MYHNVKKTNFIAGLYSFSLHDPIPNFYFFFSIEILVVGKNIWFSEEDSTREKPEHGNENNTVTTVKILSLKNLSPRWNHHCQLI